MLTLKTPVSENIDHGTQYLCACVFVFDRLNGVFKFCLCDICVYDILLFDICVCDILFLTAS